MFSLAATHGDKKVPIPHAKLSHGDRYPECSRGKVYAQKEPKALVRIVGQTPLAATVYELERMRCNACGQVFTAEHSVPRPAECGYHADQQLRP